MILVHAGNRVDGPDRDPPRFPESQVEFVERRLGRLLDALRPRVVVSAAAAGADLLLLEQALAIDDVAVHVVLPFAADAFRDTSVADCGAAWTDRYDRVLAMADGDRCQVFEHRLTPDDEGYREGNRLLIRHAQGQVADGEGVLALAVAPPASGSGERSITDDFLATARAGRITVIDIDPRIREEDMPRAFVAMPFGEKLYKHRKVDCDATFGKLIVPVLEDADLAWEREDRRIDAGIIHVGMLERLGNAHIVVVDTIAENPNVFYELGLRHAFADKTTILLGPKGTSPPFDTRPIRHFSYRLAGTRITDDEALEAIGNLKRVFDQGRLQQARRDSPVFEFFDLPVRSPASRLRLRGEGDQVGQRLADLHARVDDAADRGAVEELGRLAQEIQGERTLDPSERNQLLLVIGMGLRENLEPERAVQVLDSFQYGPDDGHYQLWAQQLALAHRRLGERRARQGLDPEPDWAEAQRLLDQILAQDKDPETYGIAGGLAKQRAVRALVQGRRELGISHLKTAARLYIDGMEADPANYYVGLNAVTTLRLLVELLGAPAEPDAQVRELLPVALFSARTAAKRDPDDFWAVVSVAELVFTAHLLGGQETEEDVVQAYAQAAIVRTRHDQLTSVRNQLELYKAVGDPPQLLDRIRGQFEQTTPGG
jgi:hypothetical protein